MAPSVFAQRVRKHMKTRELSFGKSKRVRKDLKRKNLNKKASSRGRPEPCFPNWEECSHPPAVCARVASKGLTGCGTWKCTENGRRFVRSASIARLRTGKIQA